MECWFFCLNAQRGEASHMLCFAFLVQRFGSKTENKVWVVTEGVCKMSDRPPFAQAWQQQQMRTPSGGQETIWWRPCNYCQAMYVWRYGCRNRTCATGTWVCIIFFYSKVLGRFFFLLHPPFFFGAVGDEAAFEKEIRRHQTSHMQEVAMQAAMAAVQAVMQGGNNPAAARFGPTPVPVGPIPVPPPKAKAEAEPKAEAKAKSSRKRRWTNVSLIHYFFRGYPKSMEWNFLKLNDFFANFFQSIWGRVEKMEWWLGSWEEG